MAIHDHERSPVRDYWHGARARYAETSAASKRTGTIVGLALIGFIVYMLFAAAYTPRSTTGEAIRQTPQSPQTNTPPVAPTTRPK